jgi:hypothetical protein
VLMAVTIVTWTVYAASLALRHLAGWRAARRLPPACWLRAVAVVRPPFPSPTSRHEHLRPASRITRRPSSCASARRSTGHAPRSWRRRSRAVRAKRCACRRATARSSISPTIPGTQRKRRRRPHCWRSNRSWALPSTACATTRRRSICSASPPVSIR